MPKDDVVYFGHMLETARRASAKTRRIDRQQFDANEDIQLALAYLVQIIGEAASRVSQQGRDAHPQIPWREITGTRQKIVHDYLGVDFEMVWHIVTQDLPPLIKTLEEIAPAEG